MRFVIRVLFTEEDFEKLVSGEVVKKDGVEIALQDIGYDRMMQIILEKYDD